MQSNKETVRLDLKGSAQAVTGRQARLGDISNTITQNPESLCSYPWLECVIGAALRTVAIVTEREESKR